MSFDAKRKVMLRWRLVRGWRPEMCTHEKNGLVFFVLATTHPRLLAKKRTVPACASASAATSDRAEMEAADTARRIV